MLVSCTVGLFAQTGYASIALSSGALGDGRIIDYGYDEIIYTKTYGGMGFNAQDGFFLGSHFAFGGVLNAVYVSNITTQFDNAKKTYYSDDFDGSLSFYNLALLVQYVSDTERKVFVKLGIGPSVSVVLAPYSDFSSNMFYAGLTGLVDLNINLSHYLFLNIGTSLTWDAIGYDIDEEEKPEGYTLGPELYLYIGIGFKI